MWGGSSPQEAKFLTPPQEEKMKFWGGGQKKFEAFYLVKKPQIFLKF